MSSTNPRKRVAPGANPVIPMHQPVQQTFPAGNIVGDQMVKWNGGGDNLESFVDSGANGVNSFDLLPNQPQYTHTAATPSNSLTRRPLNQALVPANQRSNFDTSIPWNFVGDETSLVPQTQEEGAPEQDNIEVLEELAQKAKRDAQGKRKQIPPFVQKLSSFLEEGKNEDLIRWSEKGDSFIVLDEDEFAKTLIPELFKHNNYASFVRQLNMYGFHKRVGLSDNSMRASERKNKSPSEYYNPYFRRGHPNLLWLINKPKGGSKPQKKPGKGGEGDGESEEEAGVDDGQPQAPSGPGAQTTKSLPSTENGSVARKEMSLIRDELNKLREQQKVIARTISRLQQNNQDLYNQAMLFQSQHDRHQNSINAILSFLANLFRKSLEEQGNTQSVSDIISSMIASQNPQSSQQGNVVDLSDFFSGNVDPTSSLTGHPHKRTRGLLPPIPDQSSSNRTTRSPSNARQSYPSHEMGHITELVDGSPAETPPNLRQELESNPQERMMRIINDHNANNSSGMDLPEAAEFVANAPNNLDPEQRNKLTNFMARQSKSPSANVPSPNATATTITAPSAAPPPTTQPAQTTPKTTQPRQPKFSPPPVDNTAAPSLSPIMQSPAMPPMSMNQISANKEELSQLQRLQSQQDQKISELNNLLGPLSPSGHVPTIEDTGDAYFDAHNVDFDQYFNFDNHLDDAVTFGGTGHDFNVDFTGGGDPTQIPTTNGENATPSPTGTEEITRDDIDANDRGLKRRRVG